MKRFLPCLLVLVAFLIGGTQSDLLADVKSLRDIPLHSKTGDRPVRRDVIPVQAYLDGELVHVIGMDTTENMTISITSADGEWTYVGTYQASDDICIPVSVRGKFEIEIGYGGLIYIGEFEII